MRLGLRRRLRVAAALVRNRWASRDVYLYMGVLPVVGLLASGAVLVGCGTSVAGDGEAATPPDGFRWAGSGQVVVAVPEWWTTGETQCLAPVEDTVYFDQAAAADCADPPSPGEVQEVSALAVLDGTQGYGEHTIRKMRPVAAVDGQDVVELDGCEKWFPGVCRRLFAVPSQGVVFAVTIAEPGDGSYKEIRDSLRILPEDMTTVPLATADGWTPTWGAEHPVVDALRTAVEEAGLGVEVATVERPDGDAAGEFADLRPGSLLEVSPELGAPISLGGTVTITIAGPRSAT